MPSAFASIQPRFDHLRDFARHVALPVRRLRDGLACRPSVDRRIAASITLLGVLASAALTLALAPQSPSAKPRLPAQADPTPLPAVPVKIIGATPRSDNCAEQVWPYIERRCLAGAADKPKTNSVVRKPEPNPADAPSIQRATTAVAPAEHAATPQSASAESAVKRRVATAYLTLPQPRSGGVGSDGFGVPQGAMRLTAPTQGRASSWNSAEDAWADRAMEPLVLGEPRRRTGRRFYRSRTERRPAFGFPF